MKYLYAIVTLAVLAVTFWFFNNNSAVEYRSSVELFTPKKQAALPQNYPLGSVIMIGHWANTPTASTTALIERYQVGGVIIMSAPENSEEILEWTKEWQAASEYPLIIAIDQEGGTVSRLRGDNFIQTSQREITTTEVAFSVGEERGEELAALGINMNFSPVLDTATSSDAFMYERVFPNENNPARLAAAMTDGLEKSGVIAAAKHFPGHPNTPTDSHISLPEIDIISDDLRTFTMPFEEYISLTKPKALMTAHVSFPQIDPEPATLSRFFLTDYLRNTLGFTGVIITDDMSMDAIDARYSVVEASIMSIAAGADMILLAAIPTDLPQVVEGIGNKKSADEAFASRLTEAQQRIHQLRTTLPVVED